MIIKKTPEEIEKMAAAGAIHARTMRLLEGKIREGVSTGELDEAAERYIRSQGLEATCRRPDRHATRPTSVSGRCSR